MTDGGSMTGGSMTGGSMTQADPGSDPRRFDETEEKPYTLGNNSKRSLFDDEGSSSGQRVVEQKRSFEETTYGEKEIFLDLKAFNVEEETLPNARVCIIPTADQIELLFINGNVDENGGARTAFSGKVLSENAARVWPSVKSIWSRALEFKRKTILNVPKSIEYQESRFRMVGALNFVNKIERNDPNFKIVPLSSSEKLVNDMWRLAQDNEKQIFTSFSALRNSVIEEGVEKWDDLPEWTNKNLKAWRNALPAKFLAVWRSPAVVLSGIDLILDEKCKSCVAISRPPGHHAGAQDRPTGFCGLNLGTMVCKRIFEKKPDAKILYVDVDLHHGDGNLNLFAEVFKNEISKKQFFAIDIFLWVKRIGEKNWETVYPHFKYSGEDDVTKSKYSEETQEAANSTENIFTIGQTSISLHIFYWLGAIAANIGSRLVDAAFYNDEINNILDNIQSYQPEFDYCVFSLGADSHRDDILHDKIFDLDKEAFLQVFTNIKTRCGPNAKMFGFLEGGYTVKGVEDVLSAAAEAFADDP